MSDEGKEIRNLIKTRGYWEVDIRPNEKKENRFESITDCLNKVRDSIIRLRGWPYPFYLNSRLPYPMQERIEAIINSGGYKEYWTMFLSGHFYHMFACREDWLKEGTQIFGPSRYSSIPPGKVLGFFMTLYSMTEIFEFAIRLAQKRVFGKRLRIKIGLFGMEGRKIVTFDQRRLLFDDYICKDSKKTFDKTISIDELIGKGDEIALETTINVFEIFNWLDVSKEILKEEQRKFIEKRI